MGVNDTKNKWAEKECGWRNESCLKCDKKLRNNSADQSRLTKKKKPLQMHSFIPYPPPFLLITDGGSESYACLIGCRARILFVSYWYVRRGFFLCLIRPVLDLIPKTLAATMWRWEQQQCHTSLCEGVTLWPTERAQMQGVNPDSPILKPIFTQVGAETRETDFVPFLFLCACVYIANWLKVSVLKSVCLSFRGLFLFHILQHFADAL